MSRLIKSFSQVFYLSFALLFSNCLMAADVNPNRILSVGGAEIEVYFSEGVAEGNYRLNRKDVLEWIERSADAVSDYFLQFPVKKLRLVINDGARNRVNGIAYHGDHPMIILNVSETFTQRTLEQDWVLVHEMVHLSFPSVYKRHNWLLEGLATYVEPIVRVRSGLLTEDDAWKWLIEGTPQGLPKAGNRGLDNTPTWGQKYWGGAIFFLLADMRIHQQTNNKYGVEHALREVQKQGGSMQMESTWEIERILKIADQGTCTEVFMTLYKEMKDKPVTTDLNAIWKRLGVRFHKGNIFYDNEAKDLKLRRAIFGND